MKKQKTFVCVNCEKQSEAETGFPYSKGWKYIYDLEWKNDNKVKCNLHDAHFCSAKCVIAFLNKHIK